jgi:hypothetical protein
MSHNLKKSLKVWSDTLNEEILVDSFASPNLLSEKKPNRERDVESYEFKSENYDDNKQRIRGPSKSDKNLPNKNHLSSNNQSNKNRRLSSQKAKTFLSENRNEDLHIRDRLGSKVSYDESKSRAHIKASDLDLDDVVAKEITKHLREPKDDIIGKF